MSKEDCSLITQVEGLCNWCSSALSGKQKRWCSSKCLDEYEKNHNYTTARAFTKRKAWVSKHKYRCSRCSKVVDAIEVNHVVPCLGNRGWGCWHHVDNLEALCIPCHREVTNIQRKSGQLGKCSSRG